jgi:predicted acyltransferase
MPGLQQTWFLHADMNGVYVTAVIAQYIFIVGVKIVFAIALMNNLLTESVCCFRRTSGRISFLAKHVLSKGIYGADVEGTVGYSEAA